MNAAHLLARCAYVQRQEPWAAPSSPLGRRPGVAPRCRRAARSRRAGACGWVGRNGDSRSDAIAWGGRGPLDGAGGGSGGALLHSFWYKH